MTKNNHSIASLLEGTTLGSVGFENDCVQLTFGKSIGVNVITDPTVELGAVTAKAGQSIFRSSLDSLVGQLINYIEVVDGKYFIFKFRNNSVIAVSLRPEDRKGRSAEAMTIHAQPHKLWVF
jgi:hypothetical protein